MENDNKESVSAPQSVIQEEALRYASIGFSIMPLGSITKNALEKKVIEYPKEGWKKYQDAIATPEEIRSWDCKNLGIVTGHLSGLLVLDTDLYKEGFDAELLKSFNLPITPTQQTASGGRQYLFKHPKDITLKNAVCIGHKESGIDIRGDGGMIVCPPSRTPYGEYIWLVSPFDEPLADIPPKLLELLKQGLDESGRSRKELPELAGLKGGEGRNNAMASFIGKLLLTTHADRWDAEVWPVAQQLNETYKPPMDRSELLSVYRSITKIETERKLKLNIKIDKELETDPEASVKNSLRETLQKDKNQGAWAIAEHLILRHSIKTIGNRDNTKDMYLYENGIYRIDYGLIKEEILNITQGLIGSHFREEVIKIIKEKTYKERKNFIVNPVLINFKNGIYDIKNNELIPHTPEYLFLHQIPINYDKEADCPRFKEFLNQILDDESVTVIQEWFGYCLYRSYFLKKAIIFLGERDTGKTTLLKVLGKFLGEENLSGVSLQKLSSDKFALSNLFQKHANVYDDLSFNDINDNGIFKMLTGGGAVTGEKKYGDQFLFNNYAKITFSCNKIPTIKDTDDDAYYSRWILIRFEHKTDNPDKFLYEKLSEDVEMSGLLNLALDGLSRLLQIQDFSYKQTPEEIKEEMCMSASSLAKFVFSQLETSSDKDSYITKDVMEQEFINYTVKNNLPAGITKETIGKKLPKFIKISSGRKSLINKETGKKVQVTCWLGVKFKDPSIQPALEEAEDELFDLKPEESG